MPLRSTYQNRPNLPSQPLALRTFLRAAALAAGLGASVCVAWAQNAPAATPKQEGPNKETVKKKDATAPTVNNSALSDDLFYQLLLGEIQVTEGNAGTGFSLILDAAKKRRDADLYKRAVELGLQARSGDAALTAAKAWAQALPDSNDAHRYTLEILLAMNRPGETGPVLKNILTHAPVEVRSDVLNIIPKAFARTTDKALALQVVRTVVLTYTEQPAHAAVAWTTLGRMELAADQAAQALQSAKKGMAADPKSAFPALLALSLLELGQPEAEPLVKRHISAGITSKSVSIPLGYARLLVDLQRTAEAKALLLMLTGEHADLAEPWLLQAALQVQDGALKEAKTSLQNFMRLAREASDEAVGRDLTQAYLLMAQVAEKENDFPAASAWLDRIENAEDVMAAQMRRASLLASQGKLEKGRELLRNFPERRPEDARLKLMAEAGLLRDVRAYQQAYEVFANAAAKFPDDVELLYDQAMMAEKAGNLEGMESLLRKAIGIKPDHHHSYNALGYSLADRGLRLPEAKQLIEKAVSLAPNDAYIQDSLGWVEFRMGNQARALEILQAAYTKRPDPEIAAHLGEVLWISGQREPALKIWREGLLLATDNESLQSAFKRFNVKP